VVPSESSAGREASENGKVAQRASNPADGPAAASAVSAPKKAGGERDETEQPEGGHDPEDEVGPPEQRPAPAPPRPLDPTHEEPSGDEREGEREHHRGRDPGEDREPRERGERESHHERGEHEEREDRNVEQPEVQDDGRLAEREPVDRQRLEHRQHSRRQERREDLEAGPPEEGHVEAEERREGRPAWKTGTGIGLGRSRAATKLASCRMSAAPTVRNPSSPATRALLCRTRLRARELNLEASPGGRTLPCRNA
jgi:hypothetical protein